VTLDPIVQTRCTLKEKKNFPKYPKYPKVPKNPKLSKVRSTEIERSAPRQRVQLVEDQDVFLFLFFLFWSVGADRGWFLEVVG